MKYVGVIAVLIVLASVATTSQVSNSPCGDWLPYKNEECVILVNKAGMQNKVDAEVVCNAFREALQAPDLPKLITVKTKEKQDFLEKILFKDLPISDNVWLGLKLEKDGNFSWNDGTTLFFTNFVDKVVEKKEDSERNCVQMKSGEGVYKTGSWTRVSCTKKNVVVCERIQHLSLAALQNVVLNLKVDMQRNKQEHEQKLIKVKTEADQKIKDLRNESDQKIAEANQQIATLKNNPALPVEFVYTQLPNQLAPSEIWKETKWEDISHLYANLFFRVAGDDSKPFNVIQEQSFPRLLQVQTRQIIGHGGMLKSNVTVPGDGTWSELLFTGDWRGNTDMYINFKLSTDPVIPRNKAVIIWKRVA